MPAFYQRQNSVALAFIVASMFWFIIGTLYGLVSAIHFVAPEAFNNIFWLVFGRVRPTHVNTVLFGVITPLMVGAGLYYTPALLKTKLWSEPLAWVSFALWQITVISGPISFAMGWSQGREYAEYPWVIDVVITLSIALLAVNLIMTIFRRKEEFLYVSVWYFVAMFIWMAGVYPIGNVMWNPATGAMTGMVDDIVLWFYGHNLPGLLLTPLAVGAAYYVIPRICRTPLYSHTLSIVGFWTLVALYTHIGGHHIIQTPLPEWLRNISVVHSLAMAVPVFTVLANIWLTMRGHGGKVLADPAGRFVLAGTIWYLITCIQGPAQSTMVVQQITHLNNWTVAHAHIAVLGFSGYIAFGAAWHVLPGILGRKVYSDRLINLQFGLITIGLSGFFVVLTAAGLVQGHAWFNGDPVYKILPAIFPYMGLRLAFGLSIITASFIGFYNLIMTIRCGEPLAASV